MRTLKRSTVKNKKIYMSIGAAILAVAVLAYGVNRQTSSPRTAQHYSASTAAPDPDTKEIIPTPSTPSTKTALQQPTSPYPVHENITATVFWVGEGADNSNDFIHNRASAWMTDWMSAYGGIDDPENRCDYRPCSFTPKENPFYFALPFNDYDEHGLKPEADLQKIPWYTGSIPENTSILKNRWIEVRHDNKVAYAQWEDVGPFGENDADYVFGSAKPAEPRAGLDLSPATADYLKIDGRSVVSWRFIDSGNVPKGEWTKIVTKSNLRFE